MGLVQNDYYIEHFCGKWGKTSLANDESPQLRVVKIFYSKKQVAEYFVFRNAALEGLPNVSSGNVPGITQYH